jgi:hypothetical protein
MNDWTCHIVIRMLQDKTLYLLPKKSNTYRTGFMMYQGNQNPVKWFTDTQVKPLKALLKKGKNNRLTLNLSLVRQLHGKSFIKQQYIKLCSQKATG